MDILWIEHEKNGLEDLPIEPTYDGIPHSNGIMMRHGKIIALEHMQKLTIFIFGNPDLENDSLPLKICPALRQIFPDIIFEIKDPNEEWDVPEELMAIDTVIGPREVTVFDDLDAFTGAPQMTMHDFDALSNLRYLKKLGKLKKVKIIGVPPDMDEKKAIEAVSNILHKIIRQ
jgi:hypothetical protein